ncbi:MAG: hypothetical protein ABFQ89_04065 [Chloroflexota bacterium]
MKKQLLTILIMVATLGLFSACGSDDAVPDKSNEGQTVDIPEVKDIKVAADLADELLDTAFEEALPVTSQLALGTIMLEGTDNMISLEQAKAMLPLWQLIQGGSLQSEAETNAVINQIESSMTREQLQVISTLRLTFTEMNQWMQEMGLERVLGQGEGGQSPYADLSEEERAEMRATAEASGEFSGGGGFGRNLSEEEKAERRATAEAGGMTLPQGAGIGSRGQTSILVEQVIEMLTEKVSE